MQGAFILVGNNAFGYPLLVVMAVGVFTYAAWRFWEGITGQGSDDAFGPFKNFFRYRLSPVVSVSAMCTKHASVYPAKWATPSCYIVTAVWWWLIAQLFMSAALPQWMRSVGWRMLILLSCSYSMVVPIGST